MSTAPSNAKGACTLFDDRNVTTMANPERASPGDGCGASGSPTTARETTTGARKQ